jgi:thiol-disulfide isomerase/thioredoxin
MTIVKTHLIVFILCINIALFAQNVATTDPKMQRLPQSSEEVHFFKGTFKEALAKAAAEKKWIFIDVYTDWCVPCKMMANEAFRDPDVADKLNAFFINFKLNPEKKGREIAQKYEVEAYPTTLIVDSTGFLIKKNAGYSSVIGFEGQLDMVVGARKEGRILMDFMQKYKKGVRDFDFLVGYARFRKLMGLASTTLTDKLVKELPKDSLALTPYKQFIASNAYDLDGLSFDYIFDNRGELIFGSRLKTLTRLYLNEAVAQNDKSLLKKLIKANTKIYSDPVLLAENNEQLMLEFYQKTQNAKETHNSATGLMAKYYMPHFEKAKRTNNESDLKQYLAKMQAIGLYYVDNVTEKKHLEEMSNLIDKACAGHECVELLTVYSQVLYRTNDKMKAKSLMNKAVTMAGNDKNLIDILEKMNNETF